MIEQDFSFLLTEMATGGAGSGRGGVGVSHHDGFRFEWGRDDMVRRRRIWTDVKLLSCQSLINHNTYV